MSGHTARLSGNRLLAYLEDQDAAAVLLDLLEPVECPLKMELAAPGKVMPFVYFLDEGVASIVAQSPEGFHVEAGLVGREGYVLPSVAIGDDRATNLCQIQVAGRGHRIAVADFHRAMDASHPMRNLCHRFLQTIFVQVACTALSNAVHQTDERLTRWLLMCHDRSASDDIAITHEFMATMLGVRRPTVTTVLHVLEGNGFIRNDRGYVQIRNRPAMEEFAGDSYGKPEEEYRRLIGAL